MTAPNWEQSTLGCLPIGEAYAGAVANITCLRISFDTQYPMESEFNWDSTETTGSNSLDANGYEIGDVTDLNTDTLASDGTMYPGDTLVSANGNYSLTYQYDGNLVLHSNDGEALWHSDTAGSDVGHVHMQSDGNLVILDSQDGVVWSSGTDGNSGSQLKVVNAGTVDIYDSTPSLIWTQGGSLPLLLRPE